MKRSAYLPALMALMCGGGLAQTTVDLRTQSKSADFSAMSSTRPVKTGTTLPGTCAVGELFFKSDAAAGKNLYACTAQNVWTLQGPAADLSGVTGVHGGGAQLQAFGGGAVNANDCAKFDASGNVVSAGAACGSGGGGGTPGGSDGQVQINSGGAFAGRLVGAGLAMDAVSLGIDSSVIPQKGAANTWTQPNTFQHDLAATGAGSDVDFTQANSTAPVKSGTTPPATCAANKELFVDTDAGAGARLLKCNATGNGWVGLDDGPAALTFGFDGGGSPIAAGTRAWTRVPYACTIQDAVLLADQAGSMVVNIKRSTYAAYPSTTSLVGTGAKPSLSAAQKSQDLDLSDWASVAIAADDVIEAVVDSASTVTRVNVTLKCAR